MPSYTSGSGSLAPASIHADRGRSVLEVEWTDGHRSEYGFVALRWLCPCAYCRGEAGSPGWLDSSPTLTAEQTQLADIRLVGTYALAPAWGDGHDSGFYTFDMLRASCPCGADHRGEDRSGTDPR
jgi:DUF971 family protein